MELPYTSLEDAEFDPKLRNERQDFAQEYNERDTEYTEDERRQFEEIINRIDFSALESIFSSYLQRSGVPPEKFNFLSSEKIVPVLTKDSSGIYSIENNLIGINFHALKEGAKAYGELEPDPETLALFLLHTLVHEEVHAISYRRIKDLPGLKITETGYQRRVFDSTDVPGEMQIVGSPYVALDEGATEKLAREIFANYLSANDFSDPEAVKEFLEILERPSFFDSVPSYNNEVKFLDEIIKQVATKGGFDRRIIWEAIIRSKLEGLEGAGLDESTFKEFIDEHTFPGFSVELRNLMPEVFSNNTCVIELTKKLKE